MSLKEGNDSEGNDSEGLLTATETTGEGCEGITAESDDLATAAGIEEIANALLSASYVPPCKIPIFPSVDSFHLFCIEILENDWLKTNSLVISFLQENGRQIVALILKRERDFWDSSDGWACLKSSKLTFYTVEQYATAALKKFFKEQGVRE